MENLPQKPEEQKRPIDQSKLWYAYAQLGTEFAIIIAVPIIGAVYLGRWLDARYNSKLLIVACILLAMAVSSITIYKRIMSTKKMLEQK